MPAASRPAAAIHRALVALLGGLLAAPGAGAGGAAACCADPSAFRYQALPAHGTVEFQISRASPRFEFQSGPSAFQAFALPAGDQPYVVELRSFVEGPGEPRRDRVLYPTVALLTDDFLVSRSTDPESLRFELAVLEQARRPAYRLTVGIDPTHGHERYLVVFTPARLLEPHAVPPFNGPANAAESARVAYLGAAPYGHLSITLRPADPGEVAPPAGAAP